MRGTRKRAQLAQAGPSRGPCATSVFREIGRVEKNFRMVITTLCVVVVALALQTSGVYTTSDQTFSTLHDAVYKLDPFQGVRLGSQRVSCELRYVISSPQYAVYLGTAAAGGSLHQFVHCSSSETCTGSLSSASGTLDLLLASTVFVPEDFGSFQVALRILGEPQDPADAWEEASGFRNADKLAHSWLICSQAALADAWQCHASCQ